jgi:hypothetical protein
MNRLFAVVLALAVALTLVVPVMAANEARVRVVHASPDAPAVDVLVNGAKAFTNAPFKGITGYAPLAAGSYKVQVVPTGATTPVVIDATLDLKANTDYTVVAMGKLANIGPVVLVDNNAAPAAGKAHVRIVHASPDAPAVDIALKGGAVLFKNLAFKAASEYLPVDAGTYDLEVRAAGTTTVALPLPGIKLEAGKIYTFFAMGLLSGAPALTVVPQADAPIAAATALPKAGEPFTFTSTILMALVAGMAAMVAGLALRFAPARVNKDK